MLAAAIAFALSGCGGSDDGGSANEADAARATAAGLSLSPPPGWEVRDNGARGLVLAPEQSDLASRVPEGPRFTAQPASGEVPQPRALVRSLFSKQGATAFTQPSRVRIDGRGGVAIAVRERRGGRAVITGLVAVPLGAGRAYAFRLEAPARQWDSAKAMLSRILYSAEFDVTAVPRA